MKTKKSRSSPKTEHFFPQNQAKTKKKGFHQERNTFFSSISSEDLHLDAHRNQIIGRDADEDPTQIILGKGCSQIIGGIYPPSPPGFRHPCLRRQKNSSAKCWSQFSNMK